MTPATTIPQASPAFSILERIDVGETESVRSGRARTQPFSILERIDVGETVMPPRNGVDDLAFSILERIDVGETIHYFIGPRWVVNAFSILERIDVGETEGLALRALDAKNFQYPRTDRRG